MAEVSVTALKNSMNMINRYDPAVAEEIRRAEEKADHYEDILGTYLVKLSGYQISDSDSSTVSKLLKAIGDFERITDHSVNILESAEEMQEKNIQFTDAGNKEMDTLCSAVSEILTLAYTAYVKNDIQTAMIVEPLEQVVDDLKKQLRNKHIARLKDGSCSIEAGFVWADLITNLERTSDHCSNVAACVMDAAEHNMNLHESVRTIKQDSPLFKEKYAEYAEKYSI